MAKYKIEDLRAEAEENGWQLISETYHWLKDLGLQDEADKIAEAFVKPNGDFAY